MTKKEAKKALEGLLKDTFTELAKLKTRKISSHSEEYFRGRIDALAQAIRFVNHIEETDEIEEYICGCR